MSRHALKNWHLQQRAAWLYRALSDAASGTPRQLLMLELARDAETEAMHWGVELKKSGTVLPVFRPSVWVRLLGWAILRHPGPQWLGGWLRYLGLREMQVYAGEAPAAHSLQLAILDHLHDGILALLCLLMLLAPARLNAGMMLFAGMSVLLAGALLSAASAWSAGSRSERESAGGLSPDIAALARVYATRGMAPAMAAEEARRLVDALELGALEEAEAVAPAHAIPPMVQAMAAFFAFSSGGLLPLSPYLLEVVRHPLLLSAGLALTAQAVIGWRLAGLQGGTPLWNSLRICAWTGYWAVLAWIVGRVLVLLI